jgi:hypothetical protein
MGGLMIRKIELIIPCILFFVLTIIISWGVIFPPGVVVHHDWPIPPYREQIIQDFPAGFFSAWQNGADATINSRGQLILGLSNRLVSLFFNVNGEQLSKAYVFLTLWLSGLMMYFAGRAFKKSWSPSLIAGVFYMLTPWLFDRIVGGDISRMFAYVLFPLCFFLFIKSINLEDNKNGEIIIAAITGLLLLFVDNVAFIVIFATFVAYSLFNIIFFGDKKRTIFVNLKSLLMIFFIFIVSNLNWLVPSLFLPQQTDSLSLATVGDLISRSTNTQLLNVFSSTSNPMGWFLTSVRSNGTFYPYWNLLTFLIPIIVFSILLFRPKNRNVIFFSLLVVVSIFLAKGINPPFGQAYLWAYQHIPYMQVFRDSDKWVMVVLFAYSFLLLFSVDLIISRAQRIKWPSFIKLKSLRFNSEKVWSISIVLILLTTFFVSSYPFLSGDFNGQLKAVDFPSSYQDAYQWLGSQSGDFRVLWLPPDIYTQYDWLGTSYQQRDIIATYSPKPNLMIYSSSDIGTLSYFIASALYHNTTCYLSKILAIANVKYVLLRNDAEGWWWRNLGWTQDKLNYVMQHQSGLTLVKQFGAIDVYLNEYYTSNGQAISTTNNVTLVSGGFFSLTSLTYMQNTSDLYPLFIQQIPQDSVSDYANSANTLVINDGDFSSFVFSFVPQRYIINPSNYAQEGDKTIGWATLYGSDYWWLNPQYLDSVGETAITSTNATLNMPFSSLYGGQYDVWIKSFWNPNLSLIVSVDDARIGEITSESFNSQGYSWIKVDSIYLKPGNHVISIQNNSSMPSGGFSNALVSSVAIVPRDVMENAKASAINAASDKNISLIFEAEMDRLDNVSNSWVLNDSFGLNASQGLAITSKAPEFIPYEIFVPKACNYTITVRAISPKVSNVDVSIDNKDTSSLLDASNGFMWFNLKTRYLSEGQHILQMSADPSVSVDLIMLKSVNNQNSSNFINNSVSYIENSPTNYVVNTELNGSTFLFFSQPYDAGWKAYINGKEIDSVPVCSGFNLFLLNENMTGSVTIEFVKQTYFEVGLYVSLFVISVITIICIYTIIRRRYVKK